MVAEVSVVNSEALKKSTLPSSQEKRNEFKAVKTIINRMRSGPFRTCKQITPYHRM